MSTPEPTGLPDHSHTPDQRPGGDAQESASDADAGDVVPPQGDTDYDEPGDNPLAAEDDDD
jgi:hypothetical protein